MTRQSLYLLVRTKSQRGKLRNVSSQNYLGRMYITPTDSAQIGVGFYEDFNFKKRTYIKSRPIMLLSYALFTLLAQMFESGNDYYNCNVTSAEQARLLYVNPLKHPKARNKEAAVFSGLLSQGRDPFSSCCFCSVTALLKSLHWLLAQFRIKYKLRTFKYKVMHKCQPVYLHNLFKHLRSDDDQFVVLIVSSKIGEKAFGCGPPALELYSSQNELI